MSRFSKKKSQKQIPEYQSAFNAIFQDLSESNFIVLKDAFIRANELASKELEAMYAQCFSQNDLLQDVVSWAQEMADFLEEKKERIKQIGFAHDAVKIEFAHISRTLSLSYQACCNFYVRENAYLESLGESQDCQWKSQIDKSRSNAEKAIKDALAIVEDIEKEEARKECLVFLNLERSNIFRDRLFESSAGRKERVIVLNFSLSFLSKAIAHITSQTNETVQQDISKSLKSTFSACNENEYLYVFINTIKQLLDLNKSVSWCRNVIASSFLPVKFQEKIEMNINDVKVAEPFLMDYFYAVKLLQSSVDQSMQHLEGDIQSLKEALLNVRLLARNMRESLEGVQIDALCLQDRITQEECCVSDLFQFVLGEIYRCIGTTFLAQQRLSANANESETQQFVEDAESGYVAALEAYQLSKKSSIMERGILFFGRSRLLMNSTYPLEKKFPALCFYVEGLRLFAEFSPAQKKGQEAVEGQLVSDQEDHLIVQMCDVFQSHFSDDLKQYFAQVKEIPNISQRLLDSINVTEYVTFTDFNKYYLILMGVEDQKVGWLKDQFLICLSGADSVIYDLLKDEEKPVDQKIRILLFANKRLTQLESLLIKQDNSNTTINELLCALYNLRALIYRTVIRFESSKEQPSVKQMKRYYGLAQNGLGQGLSCSARVFDETKRKNLLTKIVLEQSDLALSQIFFTADKLEKFGFITSALPFFAHAMIDLAVPVDADVYREICDDLKDLHEIFLKTGCFYRFMYEFRRILSDNKLPNQLCETIKVYFPQLLVSDDAQNLVSCPDQFKDIVDSLYRTLESINHYAISHDGVMKLEVLSLLIDDVKNILTKLDECAKINLENQEVLTVCNRQRAALYQYLGKVYGRCAILVTFQQANKHKKEFYDNENVTLSIDANDQSAKCFELVWDVSSLADVLFDQVRIIINSRKPVDQKLRVFSDYLRGMCAYVQSKQDFSDKAVVHLTLLKAVRDKLAEIQFKKYYSFLVELRSMSGLSKEIVDFIANEEAKIEDIDKACHALGVFIDHAEPANSNQTVQGLLDLFPQGIEKLDKKWSIEQFDKVFDKLNNSVSLVMYFLFQIDGIENIDHVDQEKLRGKSNDILLQSAIVLAKQLNLGQLKPYPKMQGNGSDQEVIIQKVHQRYNHDYILIQLLISILSDQEIAQLGSHKKSLARLDDLFRIIITSLSEIQQVSDCTEIAVDLCIITFMQISYQRIQLERAIFDHKNSKDKNELSKSDRKVLLAQYELPMELLANAYSIQDKQQDLFAKTQNYLNKACLKFEECRLRLIESQVNGEKFIQADKPGAVQLLNLFKEGLVDYLRYFETASSEMALTNQVNFVEQLIILKKILIAYEGVFIFDQLEGLLNIRDGVYETDDGLKNIRDLLPQNFVTLLNENIEQLEALNPKSAKKRNKKKKKKAVAVTEEVVTLEKELNVEDVATVAVEDPLTSSALIEGLLSEGEKTEVDEELINDDELSLVTPCEEKSVVETSSDSTCEVTDGIFEMFCPEEEREYLPFPQAWQYCEKLVRELADNIYNLDDEKQIRLLNVQNNDDYFNQMTNEIYYLPWETITSFVNADEQRGKGEGRVRGTVFNIILAASYEKFESTLDQFLNSCFFQSYKNRWEKKGQKVTAHDFARDKIALHHAIQDSITMDQISRLLGDISQKGLNNILKEVLQRFRKNRFDLFYFVSGNYKMQNNQVMSGEPFSKGKKNSVQPSKANSFSNRR